MGDLEKVKFEAGRWSDAAENDLRRIADVTPRDMAIHKEAVQLGRFQLWDIFEGARRVGSVVWSVLKEPDGITFVINAAAVSGPTEADVTAALFDRFTEFARVSGARSVLIWTERAGLVRKLEQRGARRKYVLEYDL